MTGATDGAVLTADVFAGRVGDRFTMHVSEGRALALVLADCAVSAASADSFTLTFRGPPGAPGQATYFLEAAGLEPAPVFLVPSRLLPDGGLEYQAVFNRAAREPEGRHRA